MNTNLELTYRQLRKTLPAEEIDLGVLKAGALDGKIIGQNRAIAALRFGLENTHQGFNIYVSGLPRTGKMTAVRAFVEELAATKEAAADWCYVHNFEDPYQPIYLKFPTGLAKEFQQDVTKLMEKLRSGIPKAFESEEFAGKRDAVLKAFEEKRNAEIDRIKKEVSEQGFTLQFTSHGILMIPIWKGRMLTDEEMQILPADTVETFQKRRGSVEAEVKKTMKYLRKLEREMEDKVQEIEKQEILYLLGDIFDDLIEKYQELPEVVNHLKTLQSDILENRAVFKVGNVQNASPFAFLSELLTQRQYAVNVLISHAKGGAPVVVEMNPTYTELFGRLEKESHFGLLYSDFTLIKPGSLHRANGGFLVLQMEDLLRNPFSWEALKRALRTRQIQPEDVGERYGITAAKMVSPQPIPLNLKVILTGSSLLYYILSMYDPDFLEMFKVHADFADTMPQNEENIRGFLGFLNSFCQREKIRMLDAKAVVGILEHAMRLAEDQQRLSAQFGVISDVLREADYWAQTESADVISENHIKKAIEQDRYRSGLLQERLMEKTMRGTLLIDTEGQKEGQVNGLSLIALNHCSFGRPVRITASIGPGREGVIDIEREVKLGGPLHSKGVLILSGYLAQKYSPRQPLSLAARLVFEQSYSGVEGDSASSAEICALLSALAETPLEQGTAITGSINQRGELQAIGGVNEKIEGFFELCNARGLNGNQGVIIPQSNVQNLMLREEVIQAVRDGKFHIWAVREIDEAMEIFSGVAAGMRNELNEFPPGTVNHKIQTKLAEFAQTMKELPKAERVSTSDNV